MCDDGSDTTSVPIIVSSFSESWCGRKNCPFPYTSSACGSARSRARAGSPSSSRTSARIASQSSPVSVTWSGMISQVSRTLRSISVCSPRPNRADRALECELTFGRDGKPLYISGPYDDGDRIIRKLRRGLGDGNYDFVHMISG